MDNVTITVNGKTFTGQEANDLLIFMLERFGMIDGHGGAEWHYSVMLGVPYAADKAGALKALVEAVEDFEDCANYADGEVLYGQEYLDSHYGLSYYDMKGYAKDGIAREPGAAEGKEGLTRRLGKKGKP